MNNIQWNPWHGCHRCSPGCKNCYVYYLDALRDRDPGTVVKNKTSFNAPLKRDRYGNYKIPPGTVLGSCFTSDFFIEEADEWRGEARRGVGYDPRAKRRHVSHSDKAYSAVFRLLSQNWGEGWENVVIAVSCENQEMADKRLPVLLNTKIKHKLIFIALILEYVELDGYLQGGAIEQVSVGGESYAGARVCDFDWIKKYVKFA